MKINKSLISKFEQPIKQNMFENAYNFITHLIDLSMNEIMSRNALINSYDYYIANEALSGVETPSSSLDIFLEINAVQIELNFQEKNQYVIKKNLIGFFNRFKQNFRLFKKRENTKKNKKQIQKDEGKLSKKENYDVSHFLHDLQIQLAKLSYITTTIFKSSNSIRLSGQDEYGVDVNIYPVFVNDEYLTLYNIINKKQTIIDFKSRWDNFDFYNKETNEAFQTQVRIFNNLYWNVFKNKPNQIFIESLLINVPKTFYTNNVIETTVSIINYLKNSAMQSFVSICDNTTNLFKENLNTITLEMALKFVKSLKIDA